MSTQERAELIADITAIMEQDEQDKAFLSDLLQELMEAYQDGKFFVDGRGTRMVFFSWDVVHVTDSQPTGRKELL